MELTNLGRDAILDDGLATFNNGTIVFLDETDTIVAQCTLGSPAFAAAVDGVATANAITPDSNAAGGTIDRVEVRNAGSDVLINATATLTGNGGDFQVSSLVVAPGSGFAVSAFTITLPAEV